jgi:hypothetical protein
MDKQEESEKPSMLSPEWSDYAMKFFTEKELIDGNPLTAGLRRVAELLIGEIVFSGPIKVDRIETNDPIGKTTVIYQVVFSITDKDGNKTSKTYADVADVWAGNTDDMYAVHAPATASTKAEGRALRKALKLRVVAAEELCKKDVSQFLSQQPNQADERIKPEQIKYIDTNCKKLNIDVLKFINAGEKVYNSVYEVKRDTAAKMIDLINKIKRGEQNLNKDLVGYKEDWNNT